MTILDEKRILATLGREVPIEIVEETGSTNDDLKAAARAGAADYTVLIAKRQLGGRGREGRSFHSEGGLYMSVLLPRREESCAFITHIAAIAVALAIRSVAREEAMVKWVNDVYVGGRKVSGILTESVVVGDSRRLVVGIGVNVNLAVEDFPEELREIVGVIACDASDLAGEILRELFARIERFSLDSIRRDYRELSFLIGERVVVLRLNGEREGTAIGFSEALGLVVRYDDGSTEELISGEVRLKLKSATR